MKHSLLKWLEVSSLSANSNKFSIKMKKKFTCFLMNYFYFLSRFDTNLHRTHMIWQGSFLDLTQCPSSHFSFFLQGNVVWTCLNPAWVGLISHQGASVKYKNVQNYQNFVIYIAHRYGIWAKFSPNYLQLAACWSSFI